MSTLPSVHLRPTLARFTPKWPCPTCLCHRTFAAPTRDLPSCPRAPAFWQRSTSGMKIGAPTSTTRRRRRCRRSSGNSCARRQATRAPRADQSRRRSPALPLSTGTRTRVGWASIRCISSASPSVTATAPRRVYWCGERCRVGWASPPDTFAVGLAYTEGTRPAEWPRALLSHELFWWPLTDRGAVRGTPASSSTLSGPSLHRTRARAPPACSAAPRSSPPR